MAGLARQRSSLDLLQDEWRDCEPPNTPASTPRGSRQHSRWELVRLALHKRTLACTPKAAPRPALRKPLQRANSAPVATSHACHHSAPRALQRSSSADYGPSVADVKPLLSIPINRAAERSMQRPQSQPGCSAQELPWKVQLDPLMIDGRTRAGVRYLVRPNEHPSQEVQLRVVVNAGSLVEEEHERGLAHILEHCVFRGTKSYPDGTIDAFMKSLGTTDAAQCSSPHSAPRTV